MYILLLPPFYGIWMYGFIQLIYSSVSSRKTMSFLILTTVFIETVLGLCIADHFINKIPGAEDFYVYFIMIGFLKFLLAIIIAVDSIDFEKRAFAAESVNRKGAYKYFVRIYCMVNWTIGVWSLQWVANEYVRTENKQTDPLAA
jgi:hypothetical protein